MTVGFYPLLCKITGVLTNIGLAILDDRAPIAYILQCATDVVSEFIAMAKNNQCGECTGLCCRYFALPLDTPKDKGDYDDIRWFLCHKNITVFVEDGDWYINIKNKCKHLSEKENRCRIYNKRPRICRQYRHGVCDYVEGEYDYEMYFTNNKQLEEYIKMKLDKNPTKKTKVKSKKGKGKSKKR